MANSRDVELVIRAKNEASKAIDAITSALSSLTESQKDFGRQAGKTDSLLAQLGQEMSNLGKQVSGLSTFERLSGSVDKANAAVGRLEATVAKVGAEQARLATETEKAAESTAKLKAQAEAAAAALEREKAALAANQKNQSSLTEEVRKAESERKKLETTQARLAAAFERESAAVAQADSRRAAANEKIATADKVTKGMASALERANESYAKHSVALAETQSKQQANAESLAAVGVRLSALTGRLDESKTATQRQAEAVAKAGTELKVAQEQAKAAASGLSTLRASSESVTSSLKSQEQALAAAKVELEQVSAAAGRADDAFGKIATTARSRLLQALVEQKKVLADLKGQWDAQTARVASLGGAVKIGPNTADVSAAILGGSAAKTAYQEQAVAVSRLSQALRAAGTDVQALAAVQAAFSREQVNTKARLDAVNAALQSGTAVARTQVEAVRQAARASREHGAAKDDAAKKALSLSEALGIENRESRQAMSVFQRLRGEVLGFIAAYAGIAGVVGGIKQVVQASVELQGVQAKLNVISDGNKSKAGLEFSWIKAEADRLGVSLTVLSDQWAKFAVATHNSNLTSAESRKVFTSVVEAGRVLNLTTDRMGQALLALTQMASKGSIQMEELRGQLGEHLPGAFSIMADAVGVSEAKLLKMMQAGEVTSRELVKFGEELDRRFGGQVPDALKNTASEMGRFQTAVTLGLQAIGEAGLLDAFTEALRRITAFLRSDAGAKWFKDIGQGAASVIRGLASLSDHFQLISTAAGALIGLKLAGWFLGVLESVTAVRTALASASTAYATATASTTAYTAATGAATVATRGFVAASLALIASPAGIVIGITSIVAGIAAWATRTKEVVTTTETLARVVDELKVAYAQTGGEVEKIAEKSKTAWAYDANRGIEQAKRDLESYRRELGKPFSAGTVDRLAAAPELQGFAKDANALTEAARSGSISVSEYIERMMDLRNRLPAAGSVMRQTFDKFVAGAEGAKKSEAAMERYKAVLLTTDPATSAAGAKQLDLSKNLDSTERSAKAAANALEQYMGALKDLSAFTPGGKDKVKLQDDIDKAKGLTSSAIAASAPGYRGKLEDDFFKPFMEAGGNTEKVSEVMKSAAEKIGGNTQQVTEALQKFAQALNFLNAEYSSKRLAGMPLDEKAIIERIKYVESGGNPLAKADKSTAMGLGQFTEGTWLRLFDKVFPEMADMAKEAKLAMRKIPEASDKMLTVLTRENQTALINAGQEPSARNTYLAHFLGSGDALKVLVANPKEIAANVVQPASVAANPSVLGGGKTVGDVLAWAEKKMGGGSPIESGGVTRQENFDAKIKERADELQREAAARHESTRELYIQQEIERWQTEARKQGTQISKEQLDVLKQQAGALYDQQHQNDALLKQKEKALTAEREVDALFALRKTTQENLRLAYEVGDPMQADNIRKSLEDVNKQLADAIPKAMELATQLQGMGDAGQAAGTKIVAHLQSVKLQTVEVNNKLIDTKQINDMIANGASSAFGEVGNAIGGAISKTTTWNEALGKVRDAFLKFAADFLSQLAQMIIKQQILNMLQSMGGGKTNGGFGGIIGGLFSAVAGIFAPGTEALAAANSGIMSSAGIADAVNLGAFHTGGVVGSVPKMTKAASPAWFANAARFHTGGIPGLKPNEVPAILKKNEEVLTEDSPRNILNGGLAGMMPGAQAPQDVKIINTFDAGSFISEGLNTAMGERAFLNFVSANPSAIKAALG